MMITANRSFFYYLLISVLTLPTLVGCSKLSVPVDILSSFHNHQGWVYSDQKKYNLAILNYNKALELGPNNQIIQRNLENLKQKMR